MKRGRILVTIMFYFGLVLSFFVLIKAFTISEWNTVAGSLAVVTAIIGSITAQKIIWKQEDDLDPCLALYFDVKSRTHVAQLTIENIGGGDAYDINLEWKKPFKNKQGEPISFNKSANHKIIILRKNQKHSIFVGGTKDIMQTAMQNGTDLNFECLITYKKRINSSKVYKNLQYLTLEPYRQSLELESDEQEFYFNAAQIQTRLKEINSTLSKFLPKQTISK